MADKRSNLLLWLVLGGGAFVFFAISLLALAVYVGDDESFSLSFGPNAVAVLDLEGIIFDSKDFTEQVKSYGKRSNVKALVVRINSPGGGVAASQEIHEALKKLRSDTSKKIVVSMSSVAASGGYYVACAADKIFANPGSITGSIGVIAEWYNYGELLKWAKMQSIVIKSGDLKDAGNPTRPLTEPERAYYQGLIDGMYEQFVQAVASSRNMDESIVRNLSDGRVYTGLEAKENGLIDQIGTYEDALAEAARMAGISGEPRIVTPPKRSLSLLDLVFGENTHLLSRNRDRSESQIRFEYLWR